MDYDTPDLLPVLRRIAGALGVPIEALVIPDSGKFGPSGAEIEALLTIFTSLEDTQARNRIFAAALAEIRRVQPASEIASDGRI